MPEEQSDVRAQRSHCHYLTAVIEESIPVDVSEGLVDYLKVGFSEVNGSEGLTLETGAFILYRRLTFTRSWSERSVFATSTLRITLSLLVGTNPGYCYLLLVGPRSGGACCAG